MKIRTILLKNLKLPVLCLSFFVTQTIFSQETSELNCDIKISETRCAAIEFLVKPNTKTSSDFKVRFFDSQTKKVLPPMTKDLYLWMKMDNGHEHGSKPVKIISQADHLMVTNVFFVMVGKWQIVFNVEDETGLEKKKISFWVDVPRS